VTKPCLGGRHTRVESRIVIFQIFRNDLGVFENLVALGQKFEVKKR
jgi:hypothetical protein